VSAQAKTVDNSDPTKLIETSANIMTSELDARRAEFRKDPAKLRALVERVLLPNFDVDHSARLVLGKHWRTATPAQRQRFIDAFYGSLMTNYGDAMLEFTGDRIRVLPSTVAPDATSAVVRTEVKRSNGQKIPVNYSLRKTEQGWKAWDVVIEGISYVKSFREDFGAEIDQKGIEAVIQRLEAQNRQGAAAGAKTCAHPARRSACSAAPMARCGSRAISVS
ncbi:MAG: phospholipid-binding protein MlaC, partial [Gammaproteobacteria bacterium]